MTHASEDQGWQNMSEMQGSDDRPSRPEINAIDALERCFITAEELAKITEILTERLNFVLRPELEGDSPANENAKFLDAEPALAPMIGRMNDLNRRLQRIRRHLANTSDRISI